jgi:ADP-heptose:LPS heptosyltransferase
LQKEGVGPVVLIGGRDDKADAQAIRGMMSVTPIDLTGETSVGQLPALLSSASLLITNDSGPMHVAAAVGTPVVALFGPTSPVRTGPYGAGHRVLTHELPCRPCFSRRCSNAINMECLTSISPTQVLQAVRDQLAVRLPS